MFVLCGSFHPCLLKVLCYSIAETRRPINLIKLGNGIGFLLIECIVVVLAENGFVW